MTATLRNQFQLDLEAGITGEVRFDEVSRALYSTDASVYQIEPLGLVVPKSADDVVRTVKIAGRHGVSITARGGGTSQAGQAIGAGLVLDTSKYLNRVIEVNVGERWAWVEPGVVLDQLNAAQLRAHGLRFAPDISTASRATLGGMIANNSSGARSVLYGKTIDHVLELRVVLADRIPCALSPARCPCCVHRPSTRRAIHCGGAATARFVTSRARAPAKSIAAFRKCSAASAAITSMSSLIPPGRSTCRS